MPFPIKPAPWSDFCRGHRYRWLLGAEWLAEWVLYAFQRCAIFKLVVNATVATSIVVGIVLFAFEVKDREIDREVRRATMLASIAQVAATGADATEENPVIQILEILVRQKMDLSGLPLPSRNLSRANLNGARLSRADFNNAILYNASLENADLSDASFADGNLQGANFRGANLRNAYFGGADLSQGFNFNTDNPTSLAMTNLTDASFFKTILIGVYFDGADLDGTILTGADISAASFEGVRNLKQRQLDSACMSDRQTILTLPRGFTPPKNVCEK